MFLLIFIAIRKKIPPTAHAWIFWKKYFFIFLRKSRLKVLVFHFFPYFIHLLFKAEFYQVQEVFFAHILLVAKKNTSSGASTLFWRKKKFSYLFTQIEIWNVCFSLFCTLKIWFSDVILINLKNFPLRMLW